MATENHTDTSCTVVAVVSAFWACSAARRPPVRLAKPLVQRMQQPSEPVSLAVAAPSAAHCSWSSRTTMPSGRW